MYGSPSTEGSRAFTRTAQGAVAQGADPTHRCTLRNKSLPRVIPESPIPDSRMGLLGPTMRLHHWLPGKQDLPVKMGDQEGDDLRSLVFKVKPEVRDL